MEVWWGLGYHTIFFLAGLAAIPKDLPEAARIDGASEWQVFWHVTRPRLAPIMMILVVLRFGTAMAVIDEYLIFGGFNRASPTYTWTIFMYDQAFKQGLWRQGYRRGHRHDRGDRHDDRHGLPDPHFPSEGLKAAMTLEAINDGAIPARPRIATARQPGWFSENRSAIVRHAVINFFMVIIILPLAWVLHDVDQVAARRDARRFLARRSSTSATTAYVFERSTRCRSICFNSIYVTAGTVLITTVCAVLAGYALVHMSRRARAIVVAVLLISLYFPIRVVSIISVYEIQRFGSA